MRRFMVAALVLLSLSTGCSSSGGSKPAEGDNAKPRTTPPRSDAPAQKGADPLAPAHAPTAPSRPADSSDLHDVTPILSVCPTHGNTVSDICPTCKQAVSPR